jgi:hypothetical protein
VPLSQTTHLLAMFLTPFEQVSITDLILAQAFEECKLQMATLIKTFTIRVQMVRMGMIDYGPIW